LDSEALSKILKSGFVDLTVTFADPSEEEVKEGVKADQADRILQNVPIVRVVFKLTGD